jgi:hypothetical protein
MKKTILLIVFLNMESSNLILYTGDWFIQSSYPILSDLVMRFDQWSSNSTSDTIYLSVRWLIWILKYLANMSGRSDEEEKDIYEFLDFKKFLTRWFIFFYSNQNFQST